MSNYNLGEARGKIILETDFKSLEEGQRFLDGYKKQAEDSAQSQKQAWGKVGTAATVAGAAAVAGFGVAVAAASNFEFRLSAIQAVSGNTADEMDLVSDAALRIGRDTAYSASEAAGAMEELFKAGLTTTDVLNGAADATVALASAGEIDLPQAATIASNAMNQFNLKAEDMVNVADKISGAANASAIDVSDLGMSMAQAGAVANLAGMSFEDTTLALAAMGNAGIRGSDAGTSLKSMLMRLQPQTKEQADEMMRLGLLTEDGTNAFYDQEGSLRSLTDISGVLSGALAGMSEAQKTAALQTLFGADAIRAAAIVADTGTEGFTALAGAIDKTSAADVAAGRLDNMKGSMTILMGSVETMLITMTQAFTPMLKEVVDGITEVVNWFANLDSGTQKALVGATLLVGGLLLVFGATIKIVQGVQAATATIKAMELASKASAVASGVKTAALATQTAVLRGAAIAQTVWTEAQKAATVAVWLMKPANAAAAAGMIAMKAAQVGGAVATGVATAAQWAWNAALTANPIGIIITAIAALVGAIIWFFTQTELGQEIWSNFMNWLQEAWANVSQFLGDLWNGIVDVATTVWNGIMDAIGAVVTWFQTYVWPVIQFVIDLIVGYFTFYYDAVMFVWNGIMAVVGAVVAWFMEHVWPVIQSVINFLVKLFNFFWGVVQLVWQAIWDTISTIVGWIVDFVIGYFQFWYDTLSAILKAIWDFVVMVWNAIVDAVSPVVEGFINWIVDIWERFLFAWNYIWDQIQSTINDIWNAIVNFVRPIVSGIVDFISTTWNGLISIVTDIFNNVRDAITKPIEDALEFIGGIKDAIVGFFQGAGDWLFNAGKTIIEGFIKGLESMLAEIGNFFDDLTSWIPEIKGPPEKDRVLLAENGRLIMRSLYNGLASEMGDVEQLLNGMNATIPATLNSTINAQVAGNVRPTIQLNLEYHAAPGDGTKTKEDVMAMLGHATELVREELG